jgi:hypothetical protein
LKSNIVGNKATASYLLLVVMRVRVEVNTVGLKATLSSISLASMLLLAGNSPLQRCILSDLCADDDYTYPSNEYCAQFIPSKARGDISSINDEMLRVKRMRRMMHRTTHRPTLNIYALICKCTAVFS